MNTKILSSLSNERGSILVMTLLILFALTAIGSTLVMISSTDLKISGNQRVTTEAFTVAEAGLNEAIHRLSLRNPTVQTIGGWTGNVAITDVEPYDPHWETRIFLTEPGSAPVGGGSVFTTGTIQNPASDYLMYSQATGTENVLSITHKWEDRNGDGLRDPDEIVRFDKEMVPPENFVKGFPVEVITVTGQTGNARRSIEAEVTRMALTARTFGAIYLNQALRIAGNPSFCGYNHDIDTPAGTEPLDCFGFHLGGGMAGVSTTGDSLVYKDGKANLYGDPVPTDTMSTNPWYSIAEVLGLPQSQMADVLALADNKSSDVSPLNGVTFIEGDASFNKNIVGEGLIYVTGNAEINGGFIFTGLIYVEGDLKFNGSAWILGSVVVDGEGDISMTSGGAVVLYSEDAIKQMVGMSMPAVILSWREM